jgi:hypothetical protein
LIIDRREQIQCRCGDELPHRAVLERLRVQPDQHLMRNRARVKFQRGAIVDGEIVGLFIQSERLPGGGAQIGGEAAI